MANTIVWLFNHCPISSSRYSLCPIWSGNFNIKSYIKFNTTNFRKSCCSHVLVSMTWLGILPAVKHLYFTISYFLVRASFLALELRIHTTSCWFSFWLIFKSFQFYWRMSLTSIIFGSLISTLYYLASWFFILLTISCIFSLMPCAFS